MIIELREVSKSYGALRVADAINLGVPRGEALGVIGPNGAGKSTLFGLMAGALRPDAGKIFLADRDVTRDSAEARCIAGVARSHQIPQPFEKMTVFENLLVAAAFGQQKTEREATKVCGEVLELTGLLPEANLIAGSLSLLDRKRLEMARALATGPRVLLLDEIAGGLTEGECHELVESIRTVHASGVTIVWIEHIVHALLAVVSRLMVLNFGRKIAEGDPRTVMDSAEVREIYLGSPV
jgi:branched-chain amino acid transport system ATP-binding protein